jgi:two-component system, sensor histidine kinase LadS
VDKIVSLLFILARLLQKLCGFFLMCCLAQPMAWAQVVLPPIIDLGLAEKPLRADAQGDSHLQLLALQGLDANSAPAQALNAAGYQAFEPNTIYQLSASKALWLKFKVKTDPLSQRRWALLFTKTFLDRLELHYQDAQGQWQKQRAGDWIAHAQWSRHTLAPQLPLPVLPAGEHDLLIKVVQDFPQQIPVALVPDSMASDINQHSMLLSGALLGLLGVIVLLAVHLAVSYRDWVYASYAAYALLSLLAVSSYLGVASYLWWSQADQWPEFSILFLILSSVAAQLWFCQAMFLRDMHAPWLKRAAQGVAAFMALLVLSHIVVVSTSYRIYTFAAGMSACLGLIVWIVGHALLRRQKAAYYWVAAYVPLFIIVMVALLENLSFIAPVGLPYALPAYTLAFEAMVLLLALHLHAKDRHSVQERERALAAVDPLTGFLNARAFNQRTALLWAKLAGTQQDVAVALVHVHHNTASNDSQSALRLERKLLRSVRLLNTITRDIDVVGRIGGNIVAVVMPGIPMGDDLNNRLARLVAMGLMSDPYDTEPMELHFRIAVGTRVSWGGDLKSLDNHLRSAIMQSGGWSRKPIHYITAASVAAQSQADRGLMGTVSVRSDAVASLPSGDAPAMGSGARSSSGRSSGANSTAVSSATSSI